jgi:hypothetical protein
LVKPILLESVKYQRLASYLFQLDIVAENIDTTASCRAVVYIVKFSSKVYVYCPPIGIIKMQRKFSAKKRDRNNLTLCHMSDVTVEICFIINPLHPPRRPNKSTADRRNLFSARQEAHRAEICTDAQEARKTAHTAIKTAGAEIFLDVSFLAPI